MNAYMQISQAGIDLIKKWEGCRLTAYKCTSAEKYHTIGYGHYGADVHAGLTITQEQAEMFLREDVKKAENAVNMYTSKYNWTQNEFDALVSFAYNIGNIRQLTADGTRSKDTIASKMLEYVNSGGKPLQGLINRRKEERELFLSHQSESPVVSPSKFLVTCPCCGGTIELLAYKEI